MDDLLIVYDPSTASAKGDLRAQVKDGKLVLPMDLRGRLERRNLRSARALLSALRAAPDGLAKAFGAFDWDIVEVAKATDGLVELLRPHLPASAFEDRVTEPSFDDDGYTSHGQGD